MDRQEALVRIAWHEVKQLSREEAEAIVLAFFKSPLKPSLRQKLNITTIIQWETHSPPENLNPGNPIYRPVLIDRLRESFRGATNEYLLDYLRSRLNLAVSHLEGEPSRLLTCPVCRYKTFAELGTWHTCPVCGWNSDPMQEAVPTESLGSNGLSLEAARRNFAEFGAINRNKLADLTPDRTQKYPREGGEA